MSERFEVEGWVSADSRPVTDGYVAHLGTHIYGEGLKSDIPAVLLDAETHRERKAAVLKAQHLTAELRSRLGVIYPVVPSVMWSILNDLEDALHDKALEVSDE